jgi:hypothetical protein
MNKILLTAAVLTLGTSAHAWTVAHEQIHDGAAGAQAAAVPAAFADWQDPTAWEGDSAEDDGLTWADADLKSKEMVGGVAMASAGVAADAMDMAKTSPAAAWSGAAKTGTDGMTWADADIKSKAMVGGTEMASADMSAWQGGAKTGTDGMTWADADIKSKEMVGGIAAASAAPNMGVGGPIEAQGYPACRPGRGDDNCIQLYERGVREELAAYKASGESVAMGGPYEPAADAANAKPMSSAPETATGPKVPDAGDDAAAGDHADHGAAGTHAGHGNAGAKPAATTATPNGVGGPEVRTGYPACSRSVTDSCIQLHENGVTGQGN